MNHHALELDVRCELQTSMGEETAAKKDSMPAVQVFEPLLTVQRWLVFDKIKTTITYSIKDSFPLYVIKSKPIRLCN